MNAEFWRSRRVLITGISGFVGASLTRRLLDVGADVVGIDRVKESPSLRVLGAGQVPVLPRDVRNRDRLAWALENGNGLTGWRRPEVVFHLAGLGHIKDCQEHPVEALESHVQGTWNLLEACRSLTPPPLAVVCASSNHSFGSLPAGKDCWYEDDPPSQTDFYGTAKACVDLVIRAFGALGLPCAALRHTNAFGPADPHRSHIVIRLICDLLEGKEPVIYTTKDTTPVKGYLPVQDVVRAYLLLAEALSDGRLAPGAPVNAGSDTPVSVAYLAELVAKIANLGLRPRYEEVGSWDQAGYREHLDSTRLLGLGWWRRPLVDGLEETFQWYKAHGGMAWLA